MAPAIPDRWKDYKPVGQKVEGTRFVAFKVPLRENVSNTVDSAIRLDGNILLKSIPNLGLIIDLTNTKRYYDPNFFRKMGVEYEKLMIPGRETPAKRLVDKFFSLVKRFIDKNPDNDKLIGVHCTHGVNRTGFLICNYMISHLTIEPNEAINRFATARGHHIERNNYIAALHKLMASNGPKTGMDRYEISNWKDRDSKDKDVSAKLNIWRNRDDSAKHNNRRDGEDIASRSYYLLNRGEAHIRDTFERRRNSNERQHIRNKSRSPEMQRTYRSECRKVYNDRYTRNKHRSPETHKRDSYDSRRISKDNHHSKSRSPPEARRRDSYDSRRRSPPETNRNIRQPSQYCQTTRDYNKYHRTTNNSIGEHFNNSYQHLPTARSLRTDYYTNNRPISDRQRGINPQRYSYTRNANKS